MRKMTRRLAVVLLSALMAVFTCIGIAFNLPTKTAKAETIMSTSGWTVMIGRRETWTVTC